MKTIRKILPLILSNSVFLLLLNGCSSIPLDDGADSVKIYYSIMERPNCDYVGDVIGSDGNLATFMFTSNINLTQGALNDIRNNAMAMGGNAVFILRSQLSYNTTSTFVGTVYRCHK